MSKSAKKYQEPTHEEIAACAHRIYDMEGQPKGKELEHWLQAEAQLIAERKASVGQFAAKPMSESADPSKAWITPRRQTVQNGSARASK